VTAGRRAGGAGPKDGVRQGSGPAWHSGTGCKPATCGAIVASQRREHWSWQADVICVAAGAQVC
jgi:hypothetical protein